ncbi:trypsin 5G1-like isoform X2 [Cydia pomonella]|uniref:trypsin 5G1-like isoform X2 n=1 Tax=Cydia pomonella TaxID=82600 RepID=UPI002ADE3C1C|nr:trypsin 5G1-like isoform X2 [Cydia pomonella]
MAGLQLFLVFFFIVSFPRGYASTSDNLGIYGGKKISIKEVPFMAALYIPKNNNRTYFCGGTIISDRFILTAAHCLRNSVIPLSGWVYVGTDSLKNANRVVIKPEKKFCHEEYDPIDDINDICLLKLKDPLHFGSNVNRATLPYERYELEEGTLVNLTGWGYTEHSHELQDALRLVTVPISTEECRGQRKTIICTGFQGHTSCHGDSGGPLTYGRVLIGVVSGGIKRNTPCGFIGTRHTRATNNSSRQF